MRANKKSGFGFYLKKNGDYHYFMRIIKNGPAGNAGINKNDRLLHINRIKVVRWTHTKVCNMIQAADTNMTMLVESDFEK